VLGEHLPVLTANAMVDACMTTNPRQPTPDEILGMYREAL